MLTTSLLLFACVAWHASADLRFASRPHHSYRLRNEAGAVPFVTKDIFHKYMIPSTFGYKKLGPLGRPQGSGRGFPFRLTEEGSEDREGSEGEEKGEEKGEGREGQGEAQSWGRFSRGGFGRGRSFSMPPRGQKYRNYDNFLRSNIDNEQDNRDFNVDPGRDHLPFRTNETEILGEFKTDEFDKRSFRLRGPSAAIDTKLTLKPGQSVMLPFRWNNPHASEMEVNIWVFPQKMHPVVIPVKKPTCSGEGHQDNIIAFKVPEDFTKLGAKIPNFHGCNADSKPLCVLQVYAHSVESRMYSQGTPIVIPGHDKALKTTSTAAIQPITPDPGVRDFNKLRDLCRNGGDMAQHIHSAVPKWARLVSDVYTHAYMNSDYSPYSGQQHMEISKNLQASCINKMWSGNRGELGKTILTSAQRSRTGQLNRMEDRTYKRYERMANMLIRRIERSRGMMSGGTVSAGQTTQRLANCFRCLEAGSTISRRLQTNTYIPSFQLPQNMVNGARRTMNMFRAGRLINDKGQVQIYIAALRDLLPFFHAAQKIGLLYQNAMLKNTLATYPHPTQHIKKNAQGRADRGVFASKVAFKDRAAVVGCPFKCMWCPKNPGKLQGPPIINGAQATCVLGVCANCTAMFGMGKNAQSPKPPPMTENAKAMAKNGKLPALPKDAVDGVKPYTDVDGSPQQNRPAQPGEPTVKPASGVPPAGGAGGSGGRRPGRLLEASSHADGGRRRRRSLALAQERPPRAQRKKRASRRRRRSLASEAFEPRPAWFDEVLLQEGEETEDLLDA